jgi:hypothetical protein
MNLSKTSIVAITLRALFVNMLGSRAKKKHTILNLCRCA